MGPNAGNGGGGVAGNEMGGAGMQSMSSHPPATEYTLQGRNIFGGR
jgi:hypothetical protein